MNENTNVAFIESAAAFAQQKATQMHAASDDQSRDRALEQLNRVLTDIARAAKGELSADEDDDDQGENEDGEMAIDCCSQCYIKYGNNPPAYQNCINTCNRAC